LDSRALTKIQSIILTAVIVVATAVGGLVYVLSPGQDDNAIKVGVLADLDALVGKHIWQGSLLAAEQINAEGGILGKQITVIGEDPDTETGADAAKVSTALNRLLTFHKVDFVIGGVSGDTEILCQEIVAQQKRIFISVYGNSEEATQRVLDEYDSYKYFFRVWATNASATFQGMIDSLLLLRDNTGFNKIAIFGEDLSWTTGVMDGLRNVLADVYGFDLVYDNRYPIGTVDFSSYFAAAEAAGAEVLMPLIRGDAGLPFTKEWYDRQSPIFIYGGLNVMTAVPESWEWTDGKCADIVTVAMPVTTGYPLTSKTIPTRQAYADRWGETPQMEGAAAYDTMRYILYDAINRAQTIETEEVIETLEETSIETSIARNFIFTESHDVMMGENPNDPDKDYTLVLLFQWQDGEQVPVYPKKIMEEAGATYMFPDWSGPWDSIS